MSTVYVGIGQCGSQVLGSFLSHSLDVCSDDPTIVDIERKCRAVFADSEPKVLQRLSNTSHLKGRIREKNVIHGFRGRGSNWSYGYHGCRSEDHIVDRTLDSVRHEVERSDSVGGFLLFHSLAGGTGSGLGTRISEMLRDSYGARFLLHCTVSPHNRGESPLQTYNGALCLSHVLDSADGVFLFNNDHLLLQANASQTIGTTQEAINQQLSQQLTALMSPCRSLYIHPRYSRANQEPWELTRSLWSLPEAKLAQCVSAVRRSRSTAPVDWKELAKDVCVNGRAAVSTWMAPDDFLRSTLTAVCVARGDKDGSLVAKLEPIRQCLHKALRPVKWNQRQAVEFWTDPTGSPPSLTLAFNSAAFGAGTLLSLAERCRIKAESGAYLHWYARHGTSKEDVLTACERLERAAHFYSWLSKSD